MPTATTLSITDKRRNYYTNRNELIRLINDVVDDYNNYVIGWEQTFHDNRSLTTTQITSFTSSFTAINDKIDYILANPRPDPNDILDISGNVSTIKSLIFQPRTQPTPPNRTPTPTPVSYSFNRIDLGNIQNTTNYNQNNPTFKPMVLSVFGTLSTLGETHKRTLSEINSQVNVFYNKIESPNKFRTLKVILESLNNEPIIRDYQTIKDDATTFFNIDITDISNSYVNFNQKYNYTLTVIRTYISSLRAEFDDLSGNNNTVTNVSSITANTAYTSFINLLEEDSEVNAYKQNIDSRIAIIQNCFTSEKSRITDYIDTPFTFLKNFVVLSERLNQEVSDEILQKLEPDVAIVNGINTTLVSIQYYESFCDSILNIINGLDICRVTNTSTSNPTSLCRDVFDRITNFNGDFPNLLSIKNRNTISLNSQLKNSIRHMMEKQTTIYNAKVNFFEEYYKRAMIDPIQQLSINTEIIGRNNATIATLNAEKSTWTSRYNNLNDRFHNTVHELYEKIDAENTNMKNDTTNRRDARIMDNKNDSYQRQHNEFSYKIYYKFLIYIYYILVLMVFYFLYYKPGINYYIKIAIAIVLCFYPYYVFSLESYLYDYLIYYYRLVMGIPNTSITMKP